MQKATTSKEKYGEILNDTIRTDANFMTSNEITATGIFRWHNAEYDKPSDSRPVELRVEKEKNPDNVLFIEGYFSGYEYCDRKGDITHYDRVTHWRELPYHPSRRGRTTAERHRRQEPNKLNKYRHGNNN